MKNNVKLIMPFEINPGKQELGEYNKGWRQGYKA